MKFIDVRLGHLYRIKSMGKASNPTSACFEVGDEVTVLSLASQNRRRFKIRDGEGQIGFVTSSNLEKI